MLQSCYFGSCARGLAILLPLILTYTSISLKHVVCGSIFTMALSWSSLALVYNAWEGYVVMGTALFSNLFFPPVRVIVANAFGAARFGQALGALSTVQQLQAVTSPAFLWLWSDTDAMYSGPYPGLVFLVLGGVAFLGFLVAVITPGPREQREQEQRTETENRNSRKYEAVSDRDRDRDKEADSSKSGMGNDDFTRGAAQGSSSWPSSRGRSSTMGEERESPLSCERRLRDSARFGGIPANAGFQGYEGLRGASYEGLYSTHSGILSTRGAQPVHLGHGGGHYLAQGSSERKVDILAADWDDDSMSSGSATWPRRPAPTVRTPPIGAVPPPMD